MSILQLRRYQKKDADLDAVAASGVAAAWTAYTPTITAGSGAFTTVSATGRYCAVGKIIHINMDISITTNGTAAINVGASLPIVNASFLTTITGREVNLTGNILSGTVQSGIVYIQAYNNAYPGGSGTRLIVSGLYESA